jgi:tetratricopeptide (TPR) repeat protein
MFKVVKSSLLDVVFCVTCLLISLPAALCAQSSSKHPKTASQSEVVAPKLTPGQERGLRLLQTAEAESAGLQPDMHAFVLWRASYAYTKLDPKRAEKLSRDAFTATQGIEDSSDNDHCAAPGSAGDLKSWIQQRVLYNMVHKNQLHEVEQLLPHATAPVRNEITAELVRYYESKKDLQHAEALLSQLADSDNYPFGAAADLVTALGAEQSADRMSIFNQALNNFEQHATKTSFGGDDIDSFIDRTWKDVPPGLVLEAIGKVLEAAKEQGSQSHYSMSSAKGSVVLNSGYDLRLFQLLPILEELDKDKAEALLSEQTEVAEQLKTYPKGMKSLNSENTSFSYGVTDNGSGMSRPAAQQQIEAQMQERVEDILKKADADPSGALANALTLPVHGTYESSSPRSRALLGIAEKTAAKKVSVSKSALDDFTAIQDQLSPQEMIGIDRLPELYLKVGDVDGAKKAVDILVKAGNKIYEHDIDADDPNKAFKGAWPSTDLWRKAIQEAAKILPGLPEEIIADLQDAEIAAFEKVAFASALVGAVGTDDPVPVSDCRKIGTSYRMSF